MKKKSILVLLTSLILISGVFIINKNKSEDFYKDDTTYVEDEANKNESENSNGLEGNLPKDEVDNESLEENIIKVSNEEIEKTKDIGLKFIPLVHSYDLDNGHESNVKKATEYTTESMKSFMIGTFVESKQPILFKNFFAREVYEVNPIESKFNEDKSLTWEYEVKSNILDRNKEIINLEHNIVTLLFIKENNEWRVGNYATTQYR